MLPAQVLARPGWAGSGVSAESWWRRAVFYRIQPKLFQDSDGDGVGDVQGIEQRLGYVQQLGVDAIVLTPPFNEDEFSELARKAADFHLRVLAEMDKPDVAVARNWLNQGAGGLVVDSDRDAVALAAVRRVVASFPGDRVLIVNSRTAMPTSGSAQLQRSAEFGNAPGDARSWHAKLEGAITNSDPTENLPLLVISGSAPLHGTLEAQAIEDRALATMTLGSRAAVMFDAGRELGLRSPDGTSVAVQWTPLNVTSEKAAPVAVTKPQPKAEVYGAFTPYIPPPKLSMSAPIAPVVVESANALPSDLNTLPGFTAAEVKVSAAVNGGAANAASEDEESSSLLNFYRHLIAMHHGNWSIRNGSQAMLNHDAQNALVWVRRAPSGTRTTASVVFAINATDQPVQLDLGHDFDALHMRGGTLRPLLTASATEMLSSSGNLLPVETTDHVVLPSRTLFVGELYHDGSLPSAMHTRRSRRKH